ncbi:hypothetical protein [Caulobacter endophyticus]|uniref:Methyltransferase type 11 n=1 Tax=Caulobacter endophyticus TaxID=2172652 RepID=A0A2T9KAZ6_9CAUL|nr:hypothetical protein [Caulobacter endophyticus]PVM93154.1 hypothetical protein DDF67_03965 [Caulobacter endophyticus]
MRLILVLAAGAAALAACSPPASVKTERHERVIHKREPLRAIERLDCPDRQGRLTRVSIAPDGRSCGYAGENAEVTLRLVALQGDDAEAALNPIETDLKALMPHLKSSTAPKAPKGKETAQIKLPGVSIDARDEGANIRIGGMTINADDGEAQVRITKNVTGKDGGGESRTVRVSSSDDKDGEVDIRADDHGAVVRHRQKENDGVRATLVLASDKAPAGYHLAGYEARGPKGGPLAVAIVKAKDRNSEDGDLFKDMKALVRHNVGG